jgi:hypothetical protein
MGSGARFSCHRNSASVTMQTAARPTICAESALDYDQQQRRDRDGKVGGAGDIEAGGAVLHLLVVVGQEADHGEHAERHVDPEDPAPRQGLHDDAADQRADNGGKAPDAGEIALDAVALFLGIDVAGDGERDRQDRAGA